MERVRAIWSGALKRTAPHSAASRAPTLTWQSLPQYSAASLFVGSSSRRIPTLCRLERPPTPSRYSAGEITCSLPVMWGLPANAKRSNFGSCSRVTSSHGRGGHSRPAHRDLSLFSRRFAKCGYRDGVPGALPRQQVSLSDTCRSFSRSWAFSLIPSPSRRAAWPLAWLPS